MLGEWWKDLVARHRFGMTLAGISILETIHIAIIRTISTNHVIVILIILMVVTIIGTLIMETVHDD